MSTIQLSVNLNYQQLLEAILKLSPKEQLQISDALWEGSMDIPLEQQELVLARIDNARKHPERLLDWDTASRKLRS